MEKVDREKLPFLSHNSKSFDGRLRIDEKKDFIVCRFGQAIAVCGPWTSQDHIVEIQWQTSKGNTSCQISEANKTYCLNHLAHPHEF